MKIIVFLLLLLSPIPSPASIHSLISGYLKQHLDPIQPEELERVINAATRVASWFSGYTREELLCMVSNETRFQTGRINVNLPGLSVAKCRIRVKPFSCDYGITGINDINIAWTYGLAKLLQQTPCPLRSRRLQSYSRQQGIHPELISCLEQFQLEPIQLKLIRPNHRFEEATQNDLESMLIYRIFVEEDRKFRGWRYKELDTTLYRLLSSPSYAQSP